ncbi:MAG: hypothetical protein AMXMBFR53_22430 [Gemmatimonadota bacterium]
MLCGSELRAARFSNLLDAIEALRPRFLRGRGQDAHPPVAYLDGSRMSDLDFLQALSPRAVEQVGFVSSADATTRYGTGHVGGALIVSTIAGRTPGCSH